MNGSRFNETLIKITNLRFKTKPVYTTIFIFILIALLFSFIGLWISEKYKSDTLLCSSKECLDISSNILRNLDINISPCQDFYQFSCNGWEQHHHIPEGESEIDSFGVLSENNLRFLRDIFENASYSDGTRGLKLAQTYYQSCIAQDVIESRNFTPLYNQLESLYGGWALITEGNPGSRIKNDTHWDLKTLMTPNLKYFRSSFLFSFDVRHDNYDSSNFIIYFSSGEIGQMNEFYTLDGGDRYKQIKTAYIDFMRIYWSMLGVPDKNLTHLNKVYEFEKEMAKNMGDRYTVENENNYKSINVSYLNMICPLVEWHQFLQTFFKPVNYVVSKNETIGILDLEFFKKRCQIIAKYLSTSEGRLILHNAAIWYFVWKTKFLMPQSVLQAYTMYHKIATGATQTPARWKMCLYGLQKVFRLVTGRKFVEKKFSRKDKEYVENMVTEIKETFKQIITAQQWMDQADKNEAIRKVNKMKPVIGYPNNVFDLRMENVYLEPIHYIDINTFFENSLAALNAYVLDNFRALINKDIEKWYQPIEEVNAYYHPSKISLMISAGFLQYPFYYASFPHSLNFGSTGMVIGHELTHAFDIIGSEYDASGNRRQWWSNKTRESFKKKSQCMLEQYSNYTFMGEHMNGLLTLGENMADSAGLKVAFLTLKRILRKGKDKLQLPGIDYTPEQLFYIAFGQIFCFKSRAENILNNLIDNPHTIGSFRVNGVISNSRGFAEAFNCPVGSPMNPSKKCGVW